MDMMNPSRLPRHTRPGYRFASAFTLGLVLIVTGAPGLGRAGGTVSAQTLNPCELLTVDEIQSVSGSASVDAGISNSLPAFGYLACRYAWGEGIRRFKLDVVVTESSRMFRGVSPDEIKLRLLASVRAKTGYTVIPEIGEAAMFEPDSVAYASATAMVKGRILQVNLDGLFAPEKRDQIVGLLKLAASRL
jgi:hypothetical protein